MNLRIRELRKEKKLTQDELAAKIGVSVRMFAEYEKETAEISIQKLKNIADVLQVSVFDLITIESEINQVNEPPEPYHTENRSRTDIKDKLIQVLESQNRELTKDKYFLQKIVEVKFNLK